MIETAVNAGKIVEALKETEAESEARRVLSARAVELLHEAGLTRIVSPARLWRLSVAGPRPGGSRTGRGAWQHGSVMGVDGVRGAYLHRRPRCRAAARTRFSAPTPAC